ncbi:SDR family oxidoreductase [Jeotgalibaca porci]|uniref:SDR family oxidoreductase n=1 Tax=Jeotgalibaca porci TaxID=1868793 RepID=UPI00359F448D
MRKETILITGAGTGFGKNIAFRLAEMGYDVIAGVEVMSQVSALEQEAREKKLEIRLEQLDVTNPKDREKAWGWDIDILVNNAGIKEGGSLVDIPEENLRRQIEVNAIAPMVLTKEFARKMIKNKKGRIVFVSSISGLAANPFSGPYAASKHAVEAFAEALSMELREFKVEVATINPGPYLTGFNDREFETWKNWDDNPEERIFDYEKLAFAMPQFNPDEVTEPAIAVILGETTSYRNLIPEKMVPVIKEKMAAVWDKETDVKLGKRHPAVQKSYDAEPGMKA